MALDTFALIKAVGKAEESDESTGDGCQTDHCGARGRRLETSARRGNMTLCRPVLRSRRCTHTGC
jgi:hypothetical protein